MTLSAHLVMCPMKIAIQMSQACRPRVASRIVQSPNGTTICDTTEIYNGLRVSPVPCKAPV